MDRISVVVVVENHNHTGNAVFLGSSISSLFSIPQLHQWVNDINMFLNEGTAVVRRCSTGRGPGRTHVPAEQSTLWTNGEDQEDLRVCASKPLCRVVTAPGTCRQHSFR